MLKWAREHDCPWDEGTCGHAALGGHLEMLQWAREHNCPWSAMTCYAAAFNGHLEVLQWAREHDCPWADTTSRAAAASGHLVGRCWSIVSKLVLKARLVSALETKYDEPPSKVAFNFNLRRYNLAVLTWAREHGCDWNSKTCRAAAGGGHLDVLRWAREHGCDWDASTCSAAAAGRGLHSFTVQLNLSRV